MNDANLLPRNAEVWRYHFLILFIVIHGAALAEGPMGSLETLQLQVVGENFENSYSFRFKIFSI